MTEDYVIYDPEFGSYAEFCYPDGGREIEFGPITRATGFNDSDRALAMIDGVKTAAGTVVLDPLPELKDCFVRKRYMMAEDL